MWQWRGPPLAPGHRWSAYPRQAGVAVWQAALQCGMGSGATHAKQQSVLTFDTSVHCSAVTAAGDVLCCAFCPRLSPPCPANWELRLQGHCWCEADAGARAVGGDSRLAWGPVPLALIEGR